MRGPGAEVFAVLRILCIEIARVSCIRWLVRLRRVSVAQSFHARALRLPSVTDAYAVRIHLEYVCKHLVTWFQILSYL